MGIISGIIQMNTRILKNDIVEPVVAFMASFMISYSMVEIFSQLNVIK